MTGQNNNGKLIEFFTRQQPPLLRHHDGRRDASGVVKSE